MGWLEFFASLVSSLAWPVAIAAAAFFLRKQVAALLKGQVVKRVRAGMLELELDRLLEETGAQADDAGLPLDGDPKVEDIVLLPSSIEQLADQSPEAAILIAWGEVEQELEGTVRRLNLRDDEDARHTPATTLLQRHGLLKPENARVVAKLRRYRNYAAHPLDREHALTATTARSYAQLAKRIVAALRSIETPTYNPLIG